MLLCRLALYFVVIHYFKTTTSTLIAVDHYEGWDLYDIKMRVLRELHQWRNETKLSTRYFIIYSKIALWPISCAVKMLMAKTLYSKYPEFLCMCVCACRDKIYIHIYTCVSCSNNYLLLPLICHFIIFMMPFLSKKVVRSDFQVL